MTKSIWLCERCQKKFDSDEGEGGVILTEDENSYIMGKLNPIVPFQLRFEVIKLPPPERPFRSNMEEANEIMKIFSRFYAMPCRG